ncbi:MAG: hypothetical protein ACOX0X_00880 [Candidatus Dojkabacteria bacterium]
MTKKHFLVPILAILISALFPIHTHAAEFHDGNYILEAETIVEDDLYIAGDHVMIKGVVDGDVVIFGQNISVDGTVTGDLYIFGNSISIGGSSYGNITALGSNVSIKGATVGQNVFILSGMTDVDANIGKDLNVASGTTKILGSIGDDARILSGQVSSEATVGGDFLLSSESHNVNKENVKGQFILSTEAHDKSLDKDSKFQLRRGELLGFNLGMAILSFVGMYIVGVLLIYVAPVKTLYIGKKVTSSWEDLLKSFAIGLLTFIAVPLPLLILVLTIVGAPLAILITGILIFLATFGTLWTEIAVGHKVLELVKYKDDYRFLSLLVGRFLSSIIKLIPLVNTFYGLSLSMISVGAVVRMKYDNFKSSKKAKSKKSK